MGHRDIKSLHAYQRETGREHETDTDVLQGSKSSFLEGSPPKNVKSEGQRKVKYVEEYEQGNMTRGVGRFSME